GMEGLPARSVVPRWAPLWRQGFASDPMSAQSSVCACRGRPCKLEKAELDAEHPPLPLATSEVAFYRYPSSSSRVPQLPMRSPLSRRRMAALTVEFFVTAPAWHTGTLVGIST